MRNILISITLLVASVSGLKDSVLLVVSFDGLGEDLFGRHHMPNMERIRREGATVERMTGVFSTLTSVNHYAIATGTFSETNGVLGNYVYDPVYGRQLNRTDLSGEFWNYNDGVVPIWLLNERAGGFSGSMMWPGGQNEIQGARSTYVEMEDFSMEWRLRVDKVMDWITDPNKPANVVMLFIDEPDDSIHRRGPFAPEIADLLGKVDETAGYIVSEVERRGLADTVNVMFVSDHGHAECIISKHTINLTAIIPDDIPYRMFGQSMTRHILPDKESDTQRLYNILLNASIDNHYTAYLKDDLPERWHYKNNRRITPIVIVADEQYVFPDFEKSARRMDAMINRTYSPDNPHGCHGYDNTLLSMRPIFIGYGPDFRKGSVGKPILNVDLYPLMCYLIGIEPGPNNGTLFATKALLNTVDYAQDWPIAVTLIVAMVLIALGIAVLIVRHKRNSNQAMSPKRNAIVYQKQCSTEGL